MKSDQAGLRSVFLLGVIFILGLSVGYISQHNPGTRLFCLLKNVSVVSDNTLIPNIIFGYVFQYDSVHAC